VIAQRAKREIEGIPAPLIYEAVALEDIFILPRFKPHRALVDQEVEAVLMERARAHDRQPGIRDRGPLETTHQGRAGDCDSGHAGHGDPAGGAMPSAIGRPARAIARPGCRSSQARHESSNGGSRVACVPGDPRVGGGTGAARPSASHSPLCVAAAHLQLAGRFTDHLWSMWDSLSSTALNISAMLLPMLRAYACVQQCLKSDRDLLSTPQDTDVVIVV
jgi:hypothetical protein